MTVIAAKILDEKIEMSCDTQMSRGWHKKDEGYPEKIIIGEDFIIGVCGEAIIIPMLMSYSKNHSIGWGSEDRILEWGLEFTTYCKAKTTSWNQNGTLLIAHKSGLYLLEKLIPIKIADFCAIGSGFKYAESALYLGKSTYDAVDVAINLAHGCGGQIITRSVATI